MAYCVYGDVQSEFKNITFDSNSSVTDTEVTEFISQADQYIDSKISTKYQIPITDSDDLKVIKKISIQLVAGRVWDILEKSGKDAENKGTIYKTKAEQALMMIQSGEILLSNTDERSYTDRFESYNYTNEIEATIDRDDDLW